MIRPLVLLLLSILSFGGLSASAQSLRIRSGVPHIQGAEAVSPVVSPWSSFLRYSVLSDYADPAQPRSYTQSLRAGLGYKIDENWSMSGDFSVRAETVNGQIDKDREESYAETLNGSTAVELDFQKAFLGNHSYTFFAHGEPLWDEASRREGYKGIVGGGASLSLAFFNKRYSMDHVFDVSQLMNTFKYSIDTTANPDIFYTYKLVNSIRLFEKLRLSYSWGLKLTRYTDAFTSYSYSNTISLSTAWRKWGMAVAYDNGGFTDNGEMSLWYVDQYRRVVIAMLSYTF